MLGAIADCVYTLRSIKGGALIVTGRYTLNVHGTVCLVACLLLVAHQLFLASHIASNLSDRRTYAEHMVFLYISVERAALVWQNGVQNGLPQLGGAAQPTHGSARRGSCSTFIDISTQKT